MTGFVIVLCIALYAGYRWGRWSRLRQLVQTLGSEELCKRELVTMAERQRHAKLFGLGDRDLREMLESLDALWSRLVEREEITCAGDVELKNALTRISVATGWPLGGWK